MTESGRHAGFVAIIGAPNAGKSTLVNALVGAKISIVTHKVQTTRARVRGIVMRGKTQVVLVDTPGIFAPRRRLDRAMVEAAWSEAGEADVTALLVDATKPDSGGDDPILDKLATTGRRRILVLNKVDKVEKTRLLACVKSINDRVSFERTFMVSALTGSGVEDLADWLAAAMPAGEWLFPEDQIADAPLRLTAAELTREKLYLRLHEELPYASTVETTAWKELKDGSVRIEQTIYVERESQRRIVLGHKGETIKAISMESRKDIAQVLERPVHLFLFVKVDERWGDSREHYEAMGLDFPKR
ncbi:MAG: GTPase Era [Hyphomicrobiaceae bacterium]